MYLSAGADVVRASKYMGILQTTNITHYIK